MYGTLQNILNAGSTDVDGRLGTEIRGQAILSQLYNPDGLRLIVENVARSQELLYDSSSLHTLWVLTEAIPWLLITPGPKGKDIGNFKPYFRPDVLLSRMSRALCKPIRV